MKKIIIYNLLGCCLSVKIMAQVATPVYTINFEQIDPLIINAPSSLWQIGHPQKSILNATHSGNKGIITDSLNYYPVNANSSFTVIAPFGNPAWSPFNSWECLTCITFWHQYNIDTTGGDKGFVEFSIDNGQNWYLMKDTLAGSPCVSPYGEQSSWFSDYHAATNSFSTHPLYIKGNSNGWIQSTYCWQWIIPVIKKAPNNDDQITSTNYCYGDTTLIRFRFISDSIADNKEGWLIDDIILDVFTGICSGIEKFKFENNFNVYPNPVQNTLFIEAVSELKDVIIDINDICGKTLYSAHLDNLNILKLNMNDFNNGAYFLVIDTSHESFRKLIFIQK
ncbi:MAG: hypothetical protein OHK0036_13210 [Bacteroidia bacterium]